MSGVLCEIMKFVVRSLQGGSRCILHPVQHPEDLVFQAVINEVLWVLPEIVGVLEQDLVTLRCFMVALSDPIFCLSAT